MSAGMRRSKVERLRRLYQGEAMLVLANAWDASSARVFEGCGFPAVATTAPPPG